MFVERFNDMAWIRVLIVPAVVMPILGILAYGFTRDPKEIPSPLIGKVAPPFTLTLFDGKGKTARGRITRIGRPRSGILSV